MTIGEKAKQIRKAKGLTMVQVADKAELTKQKIWQFENGLVTNPTLAMLIKVAEGLECTVVDLIAEPLGVDMPVCANMNDCKFFKREK